MVRLPLESLMYRQPPLLPSRKAAVTAPPFHDQRESRRVEFALELPRRCEAGAKPERNPLEIWIRIKLDAHCFPQRRVVLEVREVLALQDGHPDGSQAQVERITISVGHPADQREHLAWIHLPGLEIACPGGGKDARPGGLSQAAGG